MPAPLERRVRGVCPGVSHGVNVVMAAQLAPCAAAGALLIPGCVGRNV